MKQLLFRTILLCCAVQAAHAAPPAGADQLAALPDGGWLAVDKRAVRLLSSDGRERASLALRAQSLDLRPALALVIDANAERALPLTVDSAGGKLAALDPLPDPGFGIEAACLYRDAQRLDYVFLIAKDGQAQQWLLGSAGQPHRLVRRLALPPNVEHCRADDASATLYVAEEALGLWAYRADAEGPPERAAVALQAPLGKLAHGIEALAVQPGAVAALDEKGVLHTWRRSGASWRAEPPRPLKADRLAAGATLLARSGEAWRALPQPRAAATPAALPIVLPRAQTEPVARLGDAADDPAIWVHPTDAAASRILGTNKKQGLLVYDLQGRQTQLLESGRLNNVDVRQDVRFGQQRFDLALATQRDDNLMVLFTIGADGTVSEAARLPTDLEEIYGACLYQPKDGGLEAFVNDKDGRYRQYRISREQDRWSARLVRSFRLASQPEGCVADERSGLLFAGEEKRGLWVTAAAADQPAKLRMVLPVGGILQADVEGMGLYHAAGRSYLVVSSQGNNSYVVLDAAPPFAVRGAFRIGMDAAAGIDGASETDGLEVTSRSLGGPYGTGMLVVQDGFKRLPDGPQNFKLVAWSDIARALKLEPAP